MKQTLTWKRVYMVVVWLGTGLLCGTQMGFFVSQYLSYATTTKLWIRHSLRMRVPTLVSCTQTASRDSNLTLFFQRVINQPEQVVVSASGICPACTDSGYKSVFAKEDTEQDQLFRVTKFTVERRKCVALEYLVQMVSRSLLRSTGSQVYQSLLDRGLHQEAETRYYMLPPDSKGRPPIGDPAFQHLCHIRSATGFTAGTWIRKCLTYQRRVTHLLPPPYETMCRDYEETGSGSQLLSINDCIRNQSISRLKAIPPNVYIYDAEGLENIPLLTRDQITDETSEILEEIDRTCRRRFSSFEECDSESYEPIQLCGYEYDDYDLPFTDLSLESSNEPDINIRTMPAVTLFDLVMVMSNAFVVWTAFSPLHFSLSLRLFTLVSQTRDKMQVTSTMAKKGIHAVIRFLCAGACIVACVWQLQVAATDYFSYPTLTKTSITTEDVQLVPSVTVCHAGVLSQNPSQYQTVQQLLQGNRIRDRNMLLELNVAFKATRFSRGNSSCTTMNPETESVSTSDPREHDMLTLKISNATDEKNSLYVHADDKICGSYDSFVDSFFLTLTTYVLTFSHYRELLLPPPYNTSCRDYDGSTFVSQPDCIESCAIRRSISEFDSFPLFLASAYLPWNVSFERRLNHSRNLLLEEYCEEQCPHADCSWSEYAVYLSRLSSSWTTKGSANDSMSSHFLLMASTQPLHVIRSVAVYDVVTFATNFMGSVAFWTGVCPFGLFLSRRLLSLFRSRRHRSLAQEAKKYYITLISLLCGGAYAYQVYCISANYMSYETKNRIEYATRLSYTVPTIDLCLTFNSSALADNFTLESVFHSIQFHEKTDEDATVSLKQYLMYNLLCHSVTVSGQQFDGSDIRSRAYEQESLFNRTQKLQPQDMLFLSLSKWTQDSVMRTPVVYVTAHNSSVAAYDASNNVIRVQHPQHVSSVLSSDAIVHLRMQRPYDTMCLPHPLSSSASNCFDSCYARSYHKAFHVYPDNAAIFLHSSSSTLAPNVTSLVNTTASRAMKDRCESRCGKDCEQSYYFLRLRQQVFGVNRWSFSFSRPHQLVTKIISSAKTTFADFVSVLLNGASFWLMFCPCSLLLSPRVLRRFHPRPRTRSYDSYIKRQLRLMDHWFEAQEGGTWRYSETRMKRVRRFRRRRRRRTRF